METGKVKITVIPNGPLQVESSEIELIKTDGTSQTKKGKLYFCRCGHSKNKPFCDGSHNSEGFKG
ncbi:MAG: CDGSH iron-sulfur domain-containing protein [candidate division Zixibacteria bacterium]|nr:CDGSH iron-sulfur domain-containing protein [candidate division Zixibacteria bacterium]